MLRKPVPYPDFPDSDAGQEFDDAQQIAEAGRSDGEGIVPVSSDQAARTPLRWRLAMLTAVVVAVAIGAMTVVTYWTITTSVSHSVDDQLEDKATVMVNRTINPLYYQMVEEDVETFKELNPGIRISISPPSWSFSTGDQIPITAVTDDTNEPVQTTLRTIGNERVLQKNHEFGATVVLAQDLEEIQDLTSALGAVLLVITALGILLAIAAGMVVATAGLRPLSRLQRAVEYVTRTDDLRPIQVVGNDELAQLTRSYNVMLAALQDSRRRQSQLVADAGHELKTPLTSMRTNIELLMMLYDSGNQDKMSIEDRKSLEADVLAQMEEMSTLIGDLVDLAREETPVREAEPVDLDDVLGTSLERAQRRRPDVTFRLVTIPWVVMGDPFSIGRATLNLMDNAAKWSPKGGVVRVRLRQVDDETAELSVADSGVGIAEHERERVFERFYRATESRSMPGSGLGLAIVKQVIERIGGSIRVEESSDGGAKMIASFPGYLDPAANAAGEVAPTTSIHAADEYGEAFVERWTQGTDE